MTCGTRPLPLADSGRSKVADPAIGGLVGASISISSPSCSLGLSGPPAPPRLEVVLLLSTSVLPLPPLDFVATLKLDALLVARLRALLHLDPPTVRVLRPDRMEAPSSASDMCLASELAADELVPALLLVPAVFVRLGRCAGVDDEPKSESTDVDVMGGAGLEAGARQLILD